MFNDDLCQCTRGVKLRMLFVSLCDEVVELLESGDGEELGDCMYILSQLISRVVGVEVLLPLAQSSLDKGRRRFEEHGCVRSERNRCNS